MSRKRSFLTLREDADADGGQTGPLGENSRPQPEEGHRPMRAFLSINETHLRDALVAFVEELARSTRGRDW